MSPPPAAPVPAPPLPLWRSLEGLLPTVPGTVERAGPRWWWGGPLDVEGLALGAVEAFATALAAFAPGSVASRVSMQSAVVAASFESFGRLRVDGANRAGFAPLSGFHRTSDGWVRLHANYPHHLQALVGALGAPSAEAVPHALSRRTSAEVEETVTAGGGLAVAVQTPAEWSGSTSAAAVSRSPWIRYDLETAGPGADVPQAEGPHPLRGVRVLDLTRVIAGPSASRLLGALGADVLRIDPPRIPELWDHHVDTGFDKRSAVADLADRETRDRVHELLDAADAVLVGYSLSSLQRFGFDPSSLREAHPHLAVVSLDAWGTTGPRAGLPGFDSIVQAATGIAHVYGDGEGGDWRPGALPVQALDHATGLGMGAALLALLACRREGRSGRAHLSLARTAVELLRAVSPSGSPAPLATVDLRQSPSPYGALDFVPPPLSLGGTQLEYTSAPVRYGSSPLAWQDRT